MDKCSSLLGIIVSDEGKKFYNMDTWCSKLVLDSKMSNLGIMLNEGLRLKLLSRRSLREVA